MIDPTKNLSVQPANDFAALKLDKAALNPQPLPPKGAHAYADGAVIAARSDAVSLNPQPLPPKEIAATGLSAVNPAVWRMGISIEGLPQQIGKVVSDVLSKVALNPQPLPPKTVGNLIADLIGKIGIIIVSGKTPGASGPEEEHFPPPKSGGPGNQRLAEAGIIIVSGKGGKVSEEDPDGGDPQARYTGVLALQSVSSGALSAMIDESVRLAAKGTR